MTQTQELDSSSDLLEPETFSTENSTDVAEVESSPAETAGEKPESLHDLIRSVVEKTDGVESPPTEAEETENLSDPTSALDQQTPPSSDGKDLTEEQKEVQDEQLPFHKHPRFQALVAEKNLLKDEASQFRAISDYMAQNHLVPDELNQAFVVASALKNDPFKALEMLEPIINGLRNMTGVTLPPEVSERVENGEMSEEAAQELSRYRAQVALQERNSQVALQQQSEWQANQAHQQLTGAVEQWERQIAARDPDYEAKKSLVFKSIRLAHLENPARTAEEALAIANAAYAEANETLKRMLPQRGAMKSPSASQSVTSARPQPKTLMDVVRMSL